MAGIGFALRKLLRKESFLGLVQAYGYAGVIGSGPWVLSILGVMSIGIFSVSLDTKAELVHSFLISITYLMAASIITGGWLQLMLTRFISDLIFAKKELEILPNLLGALVITSVTSLVISLLLWPLFKEHPLIYRLLMLSNFVVLSNIWVLVVMLSGVRSYKKVLGSFTIGYGLTIILALLLRTYGLPGLLGGFLMGQAIMMYLMLGLLVNAYDAKQLISFEFLHKKRAFYSLAAISVMYNLGIWVDKFIFWFNPVTSESVISPLRNSIIYDPPIFLAYLSIIPGMAVFLLRMEADFVDKYNEFYNAVRNGGALSDIRKSKQSMVKTIHQGFIEIFKVQAVTAAILIFYADQILSFVNISRNYQMLFSIDVAAVGIQVVLLAVFNIFFYLDKRRIVLVLTILFFVANVSFTLLSQFLGPSYYGYGFAVAALTTTLIGFIILSRKLIQLEYETFMLQR